MIDHVLYDWRKNMSILAKEAKIKPLVGLVLCILAITPCMALELHCGES